MLSRISSITLRKEVKSDLADEDAIQALRVERSEIQNDEESTTQSESSDTNKYLGLVAMSSPMEPKLLAAKIAELVGNERGSDGKSTSQEKPNLRPLDLFGIEVGVLRRRQSLTIEELALKANMGVNTLLSIELGLASLEDVITHINTLNKALEESGCRLSNSLMFLILDQ